MVPTLHVVFSRPTPPTLAERSYPLLSDPLGSIENLRRNLISWIAEEALAGDYDAAEWVLLCAIARVQSRTPPILPLALTLSRFPLPPSMTFSPTLVYVLQQIFPIVVLVPLSLATLNTTSFVPESKDDNLRSGWLQLPSGSVAVMSEGGIAEGSVSELGISNFRAIQTAISSQTLQYSFPFSRFSFDIDIAFLLLTEGKESTFFQTGVTLPLRPQEDKHDFDFYKPSDNVKLPSHEELNLYRRLVGGSKVGTISMDNKTAEFIQRDFVNDRKATTPQAITSDDLIQTMLVARLLALSLHYSSITVEIWERAKALESRRKKRLT